MTRIRAHRGFWSILVARYACVYLPNWPITVLLRRALRSQILQGQQVRAPSEEERERAPAVPANFTMLTRTIHQRDLVMHCCPAASRRGIRAGMSLAHARALLPSSTPPHSLLVRPHHAERDQAALRRLAAWATRYAPVCGVPEPVTSAGASAQLLFDQPACLLLDLSGCERVYATWQTFMGMLDAALAGRCRGAGPITPPRIAIAPTLGSAWALALFSPARCTVLPGASDAPALSGTAPAVTMTAMITQACGCLPAAALRLPGETLMAMSEVGILAVSDVLAIPRRELAKRYGSRVLTSIDRLFGELHEPIVPITPRPVPSVTYASDGAMKDTGILNNVCKRLLVDLLALLGKQGRAVRTLSTTLIKLDIAARSTMTIRFSLSRPSLSYKHLWAMLSRRLEKIHLGFGIETITLAAARCGKHAPVAPDLLTVGSSNASEHSPSPSPAALQSSLGELIDTLRDRLGPSRLIGQLAPATYGELAAKHLTITDAAMRPSGTQDILALPAPHRPSLILAQAERAEVISLVPDGPPLQMRWRSAQHRIIAWHGPEHLAMPSRPRPLARKTPSLATNPAATNSEAPEAPDLSPDFLPDCQLFCAQLECGLWVWLARQLHGAHDSAAGTWAVRGIWC